jgi:hypothetical protein
LVLKHRLAIGVLALAAACAVSPDAYAQRAAGPFAGLFGGQQPSGTRPAPGAPEVSQTVDLRWSAYEGYDDVAQDQFGNIVPESEFQKSGVYSGFSAGLGYQRNSRAINVALNASTSARAYGSSYNLTAPTYSAGGSIAMPLGRRTMINTSVGIGYASFYQFTPFLAILAPEALTFTPGYGSIAAGRTSLGISTSAGLSQTLWRHASIGGNLRWFRREFLDGTESPLDARGYQLKFQQGLTRGLGFHAGYDYQEGRLDAAPGEINPTIRNLDIGLDYSKALSFSRRTTVSFGTGTAIAQNESGSQYHLNAQATLNQQIGRTWNANVSFNRGSQFVEGLRDLVFADSVTASVHGQPMSRLELTGSLATTSGTVGIKVLAPHFSSYTASGKVAVAVTRLLGVFTQYTYYRYDVPPGSPTALDFRPRLGRQSVMVGLSGWFPIVEDARGSRGSR